jgi:hypothetical protein
VTRLRAAAALAAIIALALLTTVQVGYAAAPRLSFKLTAGPTAPVAPGAEFSVSVRERNRSGKAAPATVVRFVLKKKTKKLAVGTAESRRLAKRKSRVLDADLKVPATAAVGTYDLLACLRYKLHGRRVTTCRTLGSVNVQPPSVGNPGGGDPGGGDPGGNPPGPDTTAPTFAGLTRACAGGIYGPEGSPHSLEWSAATDDVTPQSSIVYDIYTASSSDAFDFTTPKATTAPGATSYGITTTDTHFIVRARDAAGNRDTNTNEGSDATCPLAP